MADSAESEQLLWKSQFEEGERGGGVVSRQRKREHNSDSPEVVVKFIFFKLNFMSVLLTHRMAGIQLTNLWDGFYIRNKAPG